jgi:hypothetical protein
MEECSRLSRSWYSVLNAVMGFQQGCVKRSKMVLGLRLGGKHEREVVAFAVGFVLSPNLSLEFHIPPMILDEAHSWRDGHRGSPGEKASPREIAERCHEW